MGQKVHPEAMRVGYIHDWKSNWFNERHFSDFLIEDVRIRDHIIGKLAHAGLSDITIVLGEGATAADKPRRRRQAQTTEVAKPTAETKPAAKAKRRKKEGAAA